MAEITVKSNPQGDDWLVNVTVSDSGSQTSHKVTVSKDAFEKLTKGKLCSLEKLVKKSFEFLLEREAKESILSEFEILLISRYFREYEREIVQRL